MRKLIKYLLTAGMCFSALAAFAACTEAPQHEHTYSEWTTVTEATCLQNGIIKRVCLDGDYIQTGTLTAPGHHFVDGICTRCGEVESGTVIHTHTYGEWVVDTEPTCTEAGVIRCVCVDGDDTQTGKIVALGHHYENGVCIRCGQADETFVPQFSKDLSFTLSADGTYYSVRRGSCTDRHIVIPAEYKKLPVKEIERSAFYNYHELDSVEIPESVTVIGSNAFNECRNLKNVVIPDSVTDVGSSAFGRCINLTDVVLSQNMTAIEPSTFNECSKLRSIVIPDSVTTIKIHAFNNCISLVSVTIGKGVTSMDQNVFTSSRLTTMIVSEENEAYYSSGNCLIETASRKLVVGCATSVIPDNVTAIGNGAFENCRLLTGIVIPDSVTSIGGNAFSNCSGLESIVIPDSVTAISNQAFRGCSSLKSLTIGKGVTSIGLYVFADCRSLTTISVSKRNQKYHSAGNCLIETASNTLILGCLTSVIPEGVAVISVLAFRGCTGLTSIVIPDSVTQISGWAFQNCSSLTGISIPDSVTQIGAGAFEGCSSLNEITVSSGNSVYHSAGNCLIKTSTKTLVLGCKNSVIPADGSVTSIGDSAFIGNMGLTSLTIPNGVTSIGSEAFMGCGNLKKITLPDGVTSIGSYAFRDCTDLESIVLPGSVVSIGGSAFYGCTDLTSIALPSSLKSIGESVFYGCTALVNIMIPDSVTTIGASAFKGCESLADIYYTGTAEEWQKITIEADNDGLTQATVHYDFDPGNNEEEA